MNSAKVLVLLWIFILFILFAGPIIYFYSEILRAYFVVSFHGNDLNC